MKTSRDFRKIFRLLGALTERYVVGFLALGFFIAFLAAACSGSSESPASSSNSPANSQQDRPGSEEYGLTEQELVESIEAVEAHIAECMSEAGFEYVAVDYNTVRRGMTSDKSLPGMSEEGFIDRYGFGISTLYTGLPPQLSDENTLAKIGLGKQNVRIFNSLSPADQVAYNHVLFGENPDATFAVAIETEDFTRTDGCTRTAIEKVFSAEQLTATYVNPKDALIEQDPRMVEALANFVDCMREAGFDYNYEREIEPELKKRLYAITGGAPVESLSSEAREALAELQSQELAIGAAAYRCEDKYLDPVEDKVERELFAGFQG